MERRRPRPRHYVVAVASCLAAACAQWFDIDDNVCEDGRACGDVFSLTPDAGQDAGPMDAGMMDTSDPDHGDHPDELPAPRDAGGRDAAMSDECDRYCNAITTRCTGTNADYKSFPEDLNGLDECKALCPHFAREPEPAGSSNTLACRLEIAEGPVGETSDCRAAGRGGNGVCGTYCESYCQLMRSICRVSFDNMTVEEDCETICGKLVDNEDYDAVAAERDGRSVQCRLWHLGRAAITLQDDDGTREGNMHCFHAAGLEICELPPPPPDAGDP